MAGSIEKIIAKTFKDIATGLETGSFGQSPRIALTGLGSEHGEEVTMRGAKIAAQNGVLVTYIGSAIADGVETIPAASADDGHKIMEKLLTQKEIDGAVTMHYPFPIGVSTVGRVVAPGSGNHIYIASTTGTSSADRVEAMVKNAISGIIAAKACGMKAPTLGILNIDGARQTESILKELQANGYPIQFAQSARSDGGCILRGNDLLSGSCDICVADSLTGNILVKMMSAFTTGGNYESVGDGYGPGLGQGYDRLVMIVSRASGAPVIAGALQYAADLVRGDWQKVSAQEYAQAEKASLFKLLQSYKERVQGSKVQEEKVTAPPKEVVTSEIAGIEILDLEDAVQALWKAGIYAESGMGCTGPIVLIHPSRVEVAVAQLVSGGWVSSKE